MLTSMKATIHVLHSRCSLLHDHEVSDTNDTDSQVTQTLSYSRLLKTNIKISESEFLIMCGSVLTDENAKIVVVVVV